MLNTISEFYKNCENKTQKVRDDFSEFYKNSVSVFHSQVDIQISPYLLIYLFNLTEI